MQTADLDVIKDIPGYKVILKTILRSQIQQLVEQLEQTTEEESIILTASVNDGTLCHLGSDSGKTFLNDHDDIKSQFLGFCLKRSHQKNELAKQKALEEEQAKLANQAALARTQFRGTGFAHKPLFSSKFSPRNPTPHPVNIGVGAGPRTRHLVRHAPYVVPRGTNIATRTPPKNNIDQTVIKIEADSDNSNQSATDSVQDNNKSISETGAQFTDINSSPGKSNSATASPNSVRVKDKTKTGTDTDGVKTEEDKANISTYDDNDDDDNDIEDLPAIGLSLDSDLSNLVTNEQLETNCKIKNVPVAGTSTSSAGMIEVVTDESDPTVSVKVEAISEADMELEITGVELGNVTPGGEWGGDESGMIYDGSGAIGDQSDLGPNSEQAYSYYKGLDHNQSNGSSSQVERVDAVQEGRKLPLIKDENNTYSDVLVNPSQLRSAEMNAMTLSTTKNGSVYLLNKVLKMVFSKEELSSSRGVKALDQHKLECVQEYLHTKCKKLKFDPIAPKMFTKTIQNKIGNVRQELNRKGQKGQKT